MKLRRRIHGKFNQTVISTRANVEIADDDVEKFVQAGDWLFLQRELWPLVNRRSCESSESAFTAAAGERPRIILYI
uniref:Uncharacterized protein n=1 Tax=Romanomermis culicivorax TaxID=13658 RepID=A0A915IN83_ROMCU